MKKRSINTCILGETWTIHIVHKYIYNDDNGVSYKVGNEYTTVLSIVRNVFKKQMFERFEKRGSHSYFVY